MVKDYHVRVFCSCGWSYNPSYDDPAFGPRICPNCGKYRGDFPKWYDLKDLRWTVNTVREKYRIKKKILGIIPVYEFMGYEDTDGNIIENKEL